MIQIKLRIGHNKPTLFLPILILIFLFSGRRRTDATCSKFQRRYATKIYIIMFRTILIHYDHWCIRRRMFSCFASVLFFHPLFIMSGRIHFALRIDSELIFLLLSLYLYESRHLILYVKTENYYVSLFVYFSMLYWAQFNKSMKIFTFHL